MFWIVLERPVQPVKTMGLDNFWESGKTVSFDAPLRLCGSFTSENTLICFRGKVYSDLIFHVTGVSLYQETIQNQTICEMATKLQATPYETAWGQAGTWMYTITAEEYADLQRMFAAYAKAGASLGGSW